ncbi:hypothetical protein AAZV13_05G017050 [Glycine max]
MGCHKLDSRRLYCCCYNVQFSTVSPYSGSWMDTRVDMGKKGSNLKCNGRPNHRIRGLFKVQREHPSLLQEGPNCSGFTARNSLQPADSKLLLRGSLDLMGPGPSKCNKFISTKCWFSWNN